MRYVSLFSGIEAASVAWQELGWTPVAFSEINPFACKVLAARFPDVPNLGDINDIDWSEYAGTVDLVIGGSPCQSFSVAGRRLGLDDDRGRLMFEYIRAIRDLNPSWFIWENVPGVLSQDNGRAFDTFRWELEKLGYAMCWRTLDAQFFGVAQRRRRVFLIGCARANVGAAAAVLFERDTVRGNHTSSREKRAELAAAVRDDAAAARQTENACYAIISNSIGRSNEAGPNGLGINEELSFTLTASDIHAVAYIPFDAAQISSPCNRLNPQLGDPFPTLAASGNPCVICMSGSASHAAVDDNLAGTLTVGGDPTFIASIEGCEALVRNLTPLECERLQGFPDGFTDLGDTADSPRYTALGNSIAVPVLKWLGERIQKVEELGLAK